jgi:CBS domain-containing protein
MDPVDFLSQHLPFSLLDDAGLRLLQQNLEITFEPRGTAILQRGGEPSRDLCVVRKGAVRLELEGRSLDVLAEGECFGYPSLLAASEPQFDVVAIEDCVVYRVPEAAFRKLLQDKGFGDFFLEGLSKRLRRATAQEPLPLAGDLATPVAKLVQQAPVFVDASQDVGTAARIMAERRISSVLVRAETLGIVTDSDLRTRVLAAGLPSDTAVRQVMSAPAKTLDADAPLLEALLLVLREQIHHLPLARNGEIVGVITYTDLLRHQIKSPGHILKRIDRVSDVAALADYAQEIAGMVETLFWGGLEPTEIGRIVAALNDALVQKLVRAAEEELGPVPCAYSWIVFGSEGRQEQTLITDQDNALVYAEGSEEAEAYFGSFAEVVVDGLTRAGFPQCVGGFMATNWHRSLAEWEKLFRGWIWEPDPQALLEVSNFFDFRPLAGELDLEPLYAVMAEGADRPLFLAQLTRTAIGMRPPVGLFHRLRIERQGIDLKASGIMPIVGLARVYALEARSRRRSTLARLAAAQEFGNLSPEGADMLTEGFRFLFRLRLAAQLEDHRQGGPPDNRVQLSELRPQERRHLKETFLQVREIQETLSQRFKVDLLG